MMRRKITFIIYGNNIQHLARNDIGRTPDEKSKSSDYDGSE